MAGDEELATVRRQLADVEQLADVGYWNYDLVTGVADWSDGQCRLFGLEPGTTLSYREWLDLVHPDDRDMVAGTIDAAVQIGGDYGFEHRFHRASDGAVRWTRGRGRVFTGPDGTATRVFGVNVDITTEHTAAATLHDFIADAAHELRTPSAAISQAVQALAFAEGDDREAVLQILDRQAKRLRALTTNLVDLAMVDAGPSAAVLDAVDVAEAVRDAAANAPPPEGHSLELDGVADGVRVRADKAGLDRILVNLLTNAWRYGGSNVVVSAATAADSAVELRVADDGSGVPDSIRASLFHPFRRGPQRHPEASGLGLAIVDRLVRRMGGSVAYEDGPDGGAVFVVRLEEA